MMPNVTNLLEAAANVLPSTSTNTEIEDSSKSTNKPASANPSGLPRGRKPYPRDANGSTRERKSKNWSKTEEIKRII